MIYPMYDPPGIMNTAGVGQLTRITMAVESYTYFRDT